MKPEYTMEKFTAEEQAEHRKELTTALRSGNYSQGHGCLRSDNNFCCLGVATDVYDKYRQSKGLESYWSPIDDSLGIATHRYFNVDGDPTRPKLQYNKGFLPYAVMNYFGFESDTGQLSEPVEIDGLSQSTLFGLNDWSRASFDEIANVIDEGKVKLVELD